MTLIDQSARDRVRSDLGASLFVEAGAGSGKTTVLVGRIVSLVHSGVPLRAIAAVTFTEKAAAELRDRIRVELDNAGQAAALDDLDGAAIGTLHAFARRILAEHPIEAGLPPLFEVLDEVGSRVAADRRWDELQTQLLHDTAAAPVLRLAFSAGITLDDLRALAQQLDANWDLVAERIAGQQAPALPVLDLAPLRGSVAELLNRRGDCAKDDDKLLARLNELEAWARSAEGADDCALLELLESLPKSARIGQKAAWSGDIDEIRAKLKAVHAEGSAIRGRVIDRVLRWLLLRIADSTLAAARQRAADGALQFHDLLVLARKLVRSNPLVRSRLAENYQRLLLDESQDTDPIQVELAVRIAGGAAAGQADWRDVAIPAGSVFFVGDAKQSIYRFRRADIATYFAARERLGEPVSLTTNFRSTPEVLGWVNEVFARLITARPSAQPGYKALDSPPSAGPAANGGGPSVIALGETAHTDSPSAGDVRQREAQDIAALILRAVREGWRAGERGLTLADITILAPSRNSIAGLESALDALNISYRTEAATFVYSAAEVRELLLCAKAIDDPTDELSIVSTLRAPMFGCSDPELWRWRSASGSWHPFAPPVHAGRVAEGLRQLRDWSSCRSLRTPAELLDDVLDRRRVLETAVDSPRYRETWRRLRFVVDQARAWSEAERGSLREYLRWAAGQAEDSARVTETVLPETDADAVRITTIHAAKGLEFPFVIVAGLSSAGSTQRPVVLWPAAGGVELRLRKTASTLGYAEADEKEKELEQLEDIRLLYVACTRAQRQLAVSLHRLDGKACPAAELAAACRGAAHESWSPASPPSPLPPPSRPRREPLLDWPQWTQRRAVAQRNAQRREAESATDIAHGRAAAELPSFVRDGLAKQPRDLELPPWAKGRYGTAIGRAVHGVLQTVDLATGSGVGELAAAQAQAEGVADAVDEIAAAVRAALAAPIVMRAAARRHWRETYVGTVVDGTLVEGYVDLLFRDETGLVVIDYKTDAATTGAALAAYETQLAVYARAIADATGDPVTRSILLFLRGAGAVEYLCTP